MSVNVKTENGLVKLAGLYGSQRITPNPTLAGTEDDLTGIQFGDTKYKVSSGGGGGEVFPLDSTPVEIGKIGNDTLYRQYISGTYSNDQVIMAMPAGAKIIRQIGYVTTNNNSGDMPLGGSIGSHYATLNLYQGNLRYWSAGVFNNTFIQGWVDYYVEAE